MGHGWKRIVAILTAAAGGGLAIGAMELLAPYTGYQLVYVPFATSIVLVMGTPEAEPAQPRGLIGGHLVSTVVGLGVLAVTGPSVWAAALAVGLAIAAMHLTRTMHPPAGIDPLVIVLNAMPVSFLIVPVAAGVLLLSAFAWLWHNLIRRDPWPRRWC